MGVTARTGSSGWEDGGSGSVTSLWPASCSAITARVVGQIHKRDGNTEQDSPHERDRLGRFTELATACALFAMRLRMGVASRSRGSLAYAWRGSSMVKNIVRPSRDLREFSRRTFANGSRAFRKLFFEKNRIGVPAGIIERRQLLNTSLFRRHNFCNAQSLKVAPRLQCQPGL